MDWRTYRSYRVTSMDSRKPIRGALWLSVVLLDILGEFGSNFSFDTSLMVLSNQLSLPEA